MLTASHSSLTIVIPELLIDCHCQITIVRDIHLSTEIRLPPLREEAKVTICLALGFQIVTRQSASYVPDDMKSLVQLPKVRSLL